MEISKYYTSGSMYSFVLTQRPTRETSRLYLSIKVNESKNITWDSLGGPSRINDSKSENRVKYYGFVYLFCKTTKIFVHTLKTILVKITEEPSTLLDTEWRIITSKYPTV